VSGVTVRGPEGPTDHSLSPGYIGHRIPRAHVS
jgi:hypothetical protein